MRLPAQAAPCALRRRSLGATLFSQMPGEARAFWICSVPQGRRPELWRVVGTALDRTTRKRRMDRAASAWAWDFVDRSLADRWAASGPAGERPPSFVAARLFDDALSATRVRAHKLHAATREQLGRRPRLGCATLALCSRAMFAPLGRRSGGARNASTLWKHCTKETWCMSQAHADIARQRLLSGSSGAAGRWAPARRGPGPLAGARCLPGAVRPSHHRSP